MSLREEVSWWTANKKLLRWSSLGLAALLLVWLAASLFRRDAMKDELDGLTREDAALYERLAGLESRPAGGGNPGTDALVALNQRVVKGREALESAKSANQERKPNVVDQERKKLGELIGEAESIRMKARNPAPNTGGLMADAKMLVRDFQDLDGRTVTLHDQATSAGKGHIASGCELLRDEIAAGMRRASKLSNSGAQHLSKDDESSLAKGINDLQVMLAAAEALTPPPPAPIVKRPFEPKDATLRITTNADLPQSLINKLLVARDGGTPMEIKGEDRWYHTPSEGQRILVSRVSGSPYRDLINGATDLVVAGEPTADEVAAFAAAFPSESLTRRPTSEVVALDAVSFSVHPNNSLSVLTAKDIHEQTRWIGGAAQSAEHLAAARFKLPVVEGLAGRPADAVLSDTTAVAVGVFHNEHTIRSKRLPYQDDPQLPRLKPSAFTIAAEDYAFSFRILACTSPASKNRSASIDLVNFIISERGQQVVAESGYVDLQIKQKTEPPDPVILATLGRALGVEKVSSARQLSTSLRFETGKFDLDLKAIADIERIPYFMAREPREARLVIIGFTDNTGRPETNTPLSIDRAKSVATQLLQAIPGVKWAGMGDQLPVATNDTEEGKSRNRRSEVWVATP